MDVMEGEDEHWLHETEDRVEGRGKLKAEPWTVNDVVQASTTVSRMAYLKEQLEKLLKNPTGHHIWKHWNLFESMEEPPEVESEEEEDDDEVNEDKEDEKASEKRKLNVPPRFSDEEMKELKSEVVEYGSSIDFNTKSYKWDLVYAVKTQISVLGRSGMSAKIQFVGESTHCYEDCGKKLLKKLLM